MSFHRVSYVTWPILGLLTAFLFSHPCTLTAQDLRASLFEKAELAMKSADAAHAKVLSPGHYTKAAEAYNRAEKEFNNGKNLEKIQGRLREAVTFFNKATAASAATVAALPSPLKARSDAFKANAAQYAKEMWDKAEERFEAAARKVESGDTEDAARKGGEAERYYREAELIAVKANYLDETRNMLTQADKMKVEKYAPTTLARAKELLQTAEIELEKNRYDTDYPRNLARQAKYEVKHALYLSETIQQFQSDKLLTEDLLLLSEKPLEKISGAIGIVGEFDQGYTPTTSAILHYIKTLEETLNTAQQDNDDKTRQLSMLQQQIDELEKQLGGMAKEKSALAQRIEAEKQIRQKYEAIGKTFTQDEAVVRRTPENDLIIRMIGLNFASGKSEINSNYFGLLAKVQEAINIFPQCKVRIEGHTDSFGSDRVNTDLSQKRADAVSNYLKANMNLTDDRIISVGFGETKPIANNETREGRAKNRRIDVVLITR